MKTNKTTLVPFEYTINEKKKTVMYSVMAHGKMFIGKATCGENDTFDVETGKVIAHMRAILAQRKFDLELTRSFIATLKTISQNATSWGDILSPHYMRSIQIACEEEKAQLEHIRDLKMRLDEVCNNH